MVAVELTDWEVDLIIKVLTFIAGLRGPRARDMPRIDSLVLKLRWIKDQRR